VVGCGCETGGVGAMGGGRIGNDPQLGYVLGMEETRWAVMVREGRERGSWAAILEGLTVVIWEPAAAPVSGLQGPPFPPRCSSLGADAPARSSPPYQVNATALKWPFSCPRLARRFPCFSSLSLSWPVKFQWRAPRAPICCPRSSTSPMTRAAADRLSMDGRHIGRSCVANAC
jgi:hypothetical protein